MKKLIPLFVILAAGIASAEWKLNPYTQRQDYYEAAGNSITSLTGAVTASGPGSAAATIVSVPQSAVNLSTVTTALSGKLDTGGNAATATALAADPADCSGVNFARGVAASGAAACAQPSDVTGNAATATKLATARNINGVAFDGSANINIATTSYLADGVSLALTGATFSAKSSSVTLQGNTFNGASQLVKLDALSKLPAVDGSQLLNLPSTSGGAVLASTQTFTGANTFTGSVTVSSLTVTTSTITSVYGPVFLPYYVIPNTYWIAGSTQTWTINLSTGVYELNINGSCTQNLNYIFNSDSSNKYYGAGYFANLAPANGTLSYNATNPGLLLYSDTTRAIFKGTIAIGGPSSLTSILSETGYNATASRHMWTLLYTGTGYPKTLSIFTAGTFTGHISMRKVSE